MRGKFTSASEFKHVAASEAEKLRCRICINKTFEVHRHPTPYFLIPGQLRKTAYAYDGRAVRRQRGSVWPKVSGHFPQHAYNLVIITEDMEPWQKFEQWQRTFEQRLEAEPKARQALAKWEKHVREFQAGVKRMPKIKVLRGDPYHVDPFTTDPKMYVLKNLYYRTRPPLKIEKPPAGKPPKKLLRDIENLAGRLETFHKAYGNPDGEYDEDDEWLVWELAHHYERAANLSREALMFLRLSCQPDLLDQCLGLIAQLEKGVGVSEPQALELVNVALEANGQHLSYLESEQRTGTVRKRLKSRIRHFAKRHQRLSQLIKNMRKI